jgi:hypothetical protein
MESAREQMLDAAVHVSPPAQGTNHVHVQTQDCAKGVGSGSTRKTHLDVRWSICWQLVIYFHYLLAAAVRDISCHMANTVTDLL